MTPPLALVLAHAGDAGARGVAIDLEGKLGPGTVRVLRPELLALARWSHRVDARGQARTRLALPDGSTIDSAQLGVVLNRVRRLESVRFRRAGPRDRDYAAAELHAVATSWLAGLGPSAVPSAREHPWLVPSLSTVRWVAAAAHCGLPVEECVIATTTRAIAGSEFEPIGDPARARQHAAARPGFPPSAVLVAGNLASGALSSRFGTACCAVAKLLRLPLLEFRFRHRGCDWALAEVDPLPTLLEAATVGMVGSYLAAIAVGDST